MVKVKISELAKQFDMIGKELITELKNGGVEKKSSQSSLEEPELDILFEILTQKFDDGTPVVLEKTKKEEPKVQKQVEEPPADKEESKKIDKTKAARHVDTVSYTHLDVYKRQQVFHSRAYDNLFGTAIYPAQLMQDFCQRFAQIGISRHIPAR